MSMDGGSMIQSLYYRLHSGWHWQHEVVPLASETHWKRLSATMPIILLLALVRLARRVTAGEREKGQMRQAHDAAGGV